MGLWSDRIESMSKAEENNKSAEILRFLPSVDLLLREHQQGRIFDDLGRTRFLILSRDALATIRDGVISGEIEVSRAHESEDELRGILRGLVFEEISNGVSSNRLSKLQHVINATGVVLHTNLGRAPLSRRATDALIQNASRYCNLEYDLSTGARGVRGKRALELLSSITGAESALVVNNCAAATLLVLSSLAADGETIASRGELVEIGGDFRVPEVMEQSGTRLREVGTTNRTKISDFEEAINERTKVLLSVHSSNFKIVGFTARPTTAELSELARRNNLIFYEDAGSGVLVSDELDGIENEPRIIESIQAGVDVVTFSGDKLMGGIQSGIIVGRRDLIEKIKKNPLYRALRVDKLVYACLEATLESFADGKEMEELPVLKMLNETKSSLLARTEGFVRQHFGEGVEGIEILDETAVIGGGTTPGEFLPSVSIGLTSVNRSANQIEQSLRSWSIPVIARISHGKVLLDLRTVFPDEEKNLSEAIKNALSENPS
jgi:L-seryl-tRNA(Ser) seleniumtransferase